MAGSLENDVLLHFCTACGVEQGLRTGGDDLLSAETIPMIGRERCASPAAFDKGGEFGFVGSSKTVDKLRQQSQIVAHRERFEGERFRTPSSAIGFDDYAGKLLIKAAHVDLSFFPENDCLDTIARHMIAANLHMGQQIFTEPYTKQRIIKIFYTGGEGMAIDPGADS